MNDAWRNNNPWAIGIAERRDGRIVAGLPTEPGKMTRLMVWAKTQLMDIAASGVDVEKLVKMTGPTQHERALVCGDRKGRYFVRRDGVRCNFRIDVREVGDQLELLSYVLHLEAPADHTAEPRFLRWEYSPERKQNVDALKEPLAHIHPGHKDVRVPSAVLSPKELITVFLALELWS